MLLESHFLHSSFRYLILFTCLSEKEKVNASMTLDGSDAWNSTNSYPLSRFKRRKKTRSMKNTNEKKNLSPPIKISRREKWREKRWHELVHIFLNRIVENIQIFWPSYYFYYTLACIHVEKKRTYIIFSLNRKIELFVWLRNSILRKIVIFWRGRCDEM